MQAWLESIAGPDYASALMWTIFALIGLLVLLILIRIVRGLTFGTFVAGGRNRKARLAVMDATAVDSHRRLVLVRRDDVEHLILIGGPSDVVVEQNIRLVPPLRRPSMEETAVAVPADTDRPRHPPVPVAQPAAAQPGAPPRQPPAPAPVVSSGPVETRPVSAADRSPQAAPLYPPQEQRFSSPSQPTPYTRSTPPVGVAPGLDPARAPRPVAPEFDPARAPRPAAAAAVSPPEPRQSGGHDLDDALLQELQSSLDKDHGKPATDAVDHSLDDEMSKLLAGISRQNR